MSKIIYIIDDDQQSAELMGEYVQLMGYQPCIYNHAFNFFDDVECIMEGSMMILDLNMPEMDGIEVMRKMVSSNKVLPLILVSGYDSGVLHSAEQLAKAYSLDILATISKPFAFEALESILKNYAIKDKRIKKITEIIITAADLESAIEQKQLVLHYQPQIEIKSGKLIGVESLVRWQHPQYGLVYPSEFIALAEANGLIGKLTELVIKEAVEQVLIWNDLGLEINMSVNISADNITSLSLPEQLMTMLQESNLDPSRLILEVTETALMGQLITSLDILTRMRMKGIKLSIDDFGTGYSSLSQLYRMPFTELKVDLSFVMNMSHDSEARGIVKTCISLGHELNMKVVAEGVEDQLTLDMLNEMQCDIAQGYYIAKPMSADNLLSWVSDRDDLSRASRVVAQ